MHDAVAELALQFERDLIHGLDDSERASLDVAMKRLMARAQELGET